MNRKETRDLKKLHRQIKRICGAMSYDEYMLSVEQRRSDFIAAYDDKNLAVLRAECLAVVDLLDKARKVIASSKKREAREAKLAAELEAEIKAEREMVEFWSVGGIQYNPKTGSLKQKRPVLSDSKYRSTPSPMADIYRSQRKGVSN